MQGTDKINTITNIVFVLADVLESNLINMQEEFKKNGFELRHEAKRSFNTALANIKKLRREVDRCSESTQDNFGKDSDMLNALMLMIIDRCGDDDMFHFKLYNYIKSFPSKLNLDLDLDSAFSHIFESREDENK
jgi:hypothetical protein